MPFKTKGKPLPKATKPPGMINKEMTDKLNEQFFMMKFYNDEFVDEPDGVFFALAEEMYGWDVEDWAWFVDECDRRKTYIKDKKGYWRDNPKAK